MQVENPILPVSEWSYNVSQLHPKKYFFGVLPHF